MSMREPIERRDAVNFDARPPAMRNAHHPSDLDEMNAFAERVRTDAATMSEPRRHQVGEIARRIRDKIPDEPSAEPQRTQMRDLANLAVNGLTYGEMMEVACGQSGEPEDNCPLANAWAAAFHAWAEKHLKMKPVGAMETEK